MFRPSVFGDQSRRQLWKEVLPSRVTIQRVSRLWHSISMELLYQSFYDGRLFKARRVCACLATILSSKVGNYFSK